MHGDWLLRDSERFGKVVAPVGKGSVKGHHPPMQQVTMEGQETDINGDVDGKAASTWRNLENYKQTPLLRALSNADKNWILNVCVDRWQKLHSDLLSWRADMEKWERMSENDFTDRKMLADEVNDSTVKDIFTDQNDTLGLVNGFVDFHFSQAKDDLFGTRPWISVTPEGKDDIDLAERISKHAQWKFSHSNLETTLLDALKVSTWGGTAFAKVGWLREAETFLTTAYEAYDIETNEPIILPDGSPIRDKDTLQALIEEGVEINTETIEWRESQTEDVQTMYANVYSSLIDYHDIAFRKTAPSLDLRHTDVFTRFRMGLLDAIEKYKIPESERDMLMASYTGYDETVRDHRDETGTDYGEALEERGNPEITLIEGFIRIQPSGKMPLSRLHVIFSADMHHLFKADFLANVTPGALLPVFPVRINRIPNRIFGRGYFEKFENFNDAVDRQYNSTTFRNKFSQHVYTAVQPQALKDGGEGFDVSQLDPRVPYELAPDRTIDDFITFKPMPDSNDRSIELMNHMLQMAQMISGITSAAQGELKGVPSASTATGVKDLQTRGATIVKSPIDEQKYDVEKAVEFAVHVLYANHDTDETFTWSEGRSAELLTVTGNDVAGLRSNVTMTMSQSQNTRKIESAQVAVGLIGSYLQLPEVDKVAAKPVFEQALSALGFHNAADVLRDGVVDLETLIEIAPPDIQPLLMQMAQGGMQQEMMPQDPNAMPPGQEAVAPVAEEQVA